MKPLMSAEQMLETIWRVADINCRVARQHPDDEAARELATGMELLLGQFTDAYPPLSGSFVVYQEDTDDG